MSEVTAHEGPAFRGIAEEIFGALADCFRAERLAVATLGVALSLVSAGVSGVMAAVFLLRDALGSAALLAVLAGCLLYAGLLVTFGALSRIAVAERARLAIPPTSAFSFALARTHILVGLPLFTLLVALAVGLAGEWLGARLAGQQAIGGVVGPLAFIALFGINLILICAVFCSHCLAGPCVASSDESFAAVGVRLVHVFRQRLRSFLGYQVVVLLAGLPLTALVVALFAGAFLPAFHSLSTSREAAEISRPAPTPAPTRQVRPEDIWGDETGAMEEGTGGWTERLREWLEKDTAVNAAPAMGAVALLGLLLAIFPLVFAANAQSAVYAALTRDMPAAPLELEISAPGVAEALPQKRPPIVHCWRCDAISRYTAESCSKCGARLAACPYCFSTNEPERVACSSCGRRLRPESEEGTEAVVEAEGRGTGADDG